MLGPGQLTPEAVETAHVTGDVIAALAPVGVYVTIEVAIAAVGLGRRLRADPRVVAIFVAFEIAHDIIANILPLPLTVAAAARGLSGLYCVVRRLGELCLSVQVTRAFALAGTFVPVPTERYATCASLFS